MPVPLLSGIPVTPPPDEAREWAERELSGEVYRASEPNAIDRIAQAIQGFLDSLLSTEVPMAMNPVVVVVVIAVVAALVVLGLLIWGRPRLARRRPAPSSLLFGEEDRRTAAELRAAAEDHAAAGRWGEAIADRYRALARGMEERDVLEPLPGLTAQALADIAAEFFPGHAAAAHAGAVAFDDVRYLRRPGTAEMYAGVKDVDEGISGSRPVKMAETFGAAA